MYLTFHIFSFRKYQMNNFRIFWPLKVGCLKKWGPQKKTRAQFFKKWQKYGGFCNNGRTLILGGMKKNKKPKTILYVSFKGFPKSSLGNLCFTLTNRFSSQQKISCSFLRNYRAIFCIFKIIHYICMGKSGMQPSRMYITQ